MTRFAILTYNRALLQIVAELSVRSSRLQPSSPIWHSPYTGITLSKGIKKNKQNPKRAVVSQDYKKGMRHVAKSVSVHSRIG